MSISDTLGRSRELRTSIGTISYRERGDGTPLLLIHGFLVNGDLWRGLVPLLADSFRCLSVDWPMGSHTSAVSPTADLSAAGLARLVVEVLDELGLDRSVLVGNDTGGAVAQLVTAQNPERVEALVLTSCDAFECFPPGLYKILFRLAAVPGVVPLLAQAMRSRRVCALPTTYGAIMTSLPEAPILKGWTHPTASDRGVRRDVRRLMRGANNRDTLDAAEQFAKFDRPVLVVWGADDKLFPRALGQRLANAFPDGRFELVKSARTLVAWEQPSAFARLVRRHLADAGAL